MMEEVDWLYQQSRE